MDTEPSARSLIETEQSNNLKILNGRTITINIDELLDAFSLDEILKILTNKVAMLDTIKTSLIKDAKYVESDHAIFIEIFNLISLLDIMKQKLTGSQLASVDYHRAEYLAAIQIRDANIAVREEINILEVPRLLQELFHSTSIPVDDLETQKLEPQFSESEIRGLSTIKEELILNKEEMAEIDSEVTSLAFSAVEAAQILKVPKLYAMYTEAIQNFTNIHLTFNNGTMYTIDNYRTDVRILLLHHILSILRRHLSKENQKTLNSSIDEFYKLRSNINNIISKRLGVAVSVVKSRMNKAFNNPGLDSEL